jgi:nitroreductase
LLEEGEAMEFTEVIKTRRSVRAFLDQAVPEEVLGRVLEAARLAPSACNHQPWRFIVVQNLETRKQLAAASQGFVAQAPVVIVCCGQKYQQSYNWIGDRLYLLDLGIAIEHMVLAARNEGLGSCWIGAFREPPIKTLLGVPADWDVVEMLTVGYPAGEGLFHARADRLGLREIVHREKFGHAPGG